MAFDQPSNRPFASIFDSDDNQSSANEPMDRGGESYTYSKEGRSESDNAISKNDKSAFTDRQQKQASRVKTGDNGKTDEGEDDAKANKLDGTMLDAKPKKAQGAGRKEQGTQKKMVKKVVAKKKLKPAKKVVKMKKIMKKMKKLVKKASKKAMKKTKGQTKRAMASTKKGGNTRGKAIAGGRKPTSGKVQQRRK